METVIRMHLKTLREEAAAGQYVRPLMLQYSPTELAECVDLNDEQKEKLEKHWQHFVKDIRMARSAFGQSTAGVHDRVQAAMATGQYNPTSSAEAAKVSEILKLLFKYTTTSYISVFPILKSKLFSFDFLSFQCFLLTFNAIGASDELLSEEARAFAKLSVGSLLSLSPMQIAILFTSCRPLAPHLPDVYETLLNKKKDNNNNNNNNYTFAM